MSEKKTILIVDDSRVSRMMVKAIVTEAHPEWETLEAGNGEEALATTKNTGHLDLIILDFNMPGMDGLELGTKLIEQYPDAKTYLLTANIQKSIQEKSEALGISFVKKPITQDKITSVLSSIEN